MADFDLGRLLRLQGMIESAAKANEPTVMGAPALTEAYKRVRAQVADLVEGTDLEEEFQRSFPTVPAIPSPPDTPRPRDLARHANTAEVEGRKAQTLLGQMQGWIGGIVREMTMEEQMRLDAEAKAKAAKEPPGYGTYT